MKTAHNQPRCIQRIRSSVTASGMPNTLGSSPAEWPASGQPLRLGIGHEFEFVSLVEEAAPPIVNRYPCFRSGYGG